MHAYHECWYLFMALYFEMRQLPWFKVKWNKTGEDFSQPGTLLRDKCVLLINETDLLPHQ